MTSNQITPPPTVDRPERHYAGIMVHTTMAELGKNCVNAMDELETWIARSGVEVDGPPFWRYAVINMEGLMQVEVGFPFSAPVTPTGSVRAGILPAGQYLTTVYTGPWEGDGLYHATGELLAWGDKNQVAWDRWESPDGDAWAARLEGYMTDPAHAPEPRQYCTELAFRLR